MLCKLLLLIMIVTKLFLIFLRILYKNNSIVIYFFFSNEVYRMNLEEGRFMQPYTTSMRFLIFLFSMPRSF